jgi:uncharacterized protein (TIGR02118 family)
MIKTIGLLTRKPGWTHEQFVRHWVDVHAPLAHAVPGLRRYVQNHIRGERRRADIEETAVEIDGIAELWFDRPLHRPHQELHDRGEGGDRLATASRPNYRN